MPYGFLRSWVATHVRQVPAEERAARVAKWSAECVADALIAGISFDNIHAAAGGSVLTYIAKAADYVAERDAKPTRDEGVPAPPQ